MMNDKPPTYREIAASCGYHVSYVYLSVQSLAQKGMLKVKKGKHRSIKVAA